jgi:hypothetical protein
MSVPAISTLIFVMFSSSPYPSFLDPPRPPCTGRMPRDICTLVCVLFLPDDDLDPVYFMLLWVFVGGKMLDEERMEFEFMQARLIESESKMHHYETLVRNRDQELTKTKRVSTLTYIGSNVSRILCLRACVCVYISVLICFSPAGTIL